MGAMLEFCDRRKIAQALHRESSVVWKRAKQEKWKFSEFNANGGIKRLYEINSLPEDVQLALRRSEIEIAANDLKQNPAYEEGRLAARRLMIAETIDKAAEFRAMQAGAAIAAGLTGKPRERLDAKLDILAELDTFAIRMGKGIWAAMEGFSESYTAGDVGTDEHRRILGSTISERTLHRWRKTLRARGAAGLAGDHGNRSGSGIIDSNKDLHEFVVGMIASKPHISGRLLHDALRARFADKHIVLPSKRSVLDYLKGWKTKNHELYTSLANPDRWKNLYKVAHGDRSSEALAAGLNDRWEFDSTPADVMLRDGRHSIIGVIDVWSRRLVLYVSKSSSAAGVCQALRKAILQWGVLNTAKIDNGQDYRSHRVQRALHSLGVITELSPPFSPWEKPHIERAFGTFSHGLLTLLPSYVGHNVAMAQELRARESFADRLTKKNAVMPIDLDAKTLQEFCDRWCESIYHHDKHEELGTTPYLMAAGWNSEVRCVEDIRVLDLLLAEMPDNQGMRTVTKKGLRIDNRYYAAPELGMLVRESVQVLYDPQDLGRVVVYHEDRFICVAECPEVLGTSRMEVALRATEIQKRNAQAARKAARELSRKVKTSEIVEEILVQREREANALAAFPSPTVTHLTPAIEAAREAADALEQPASPASDIPPLRFKDFEDLRDLHRKDQAQDETEEGRFKRALGLMAREQKEPLDELNANWLAKYREHSEFRGRWMVFNEWGGAAFGLGTDYDDLSEMLSKQYEEL